MRLTICALALMLAGCDGDGFSDGNRSACASGGQILGCEDDVQTPEDACWKLVQCGVFPLDTDDPETDDQDPDRNQDYRGCLDRLYFADETAAEIAIACIDASSCDALTVNDSPANPYEWPDCLEFR